MQKAIILTESEYIELTEKQAEAYDYAATTNVIERLTKEKEDLRAVINNQNYNTTKQLEEIANLTANIEELKKVAGGVKLTSEEMQELASIFNNAIKYMRMKSRDFKESDIEAAQALFMKIQAQAK